ncbi:hypothetical protein [Levilactobacillus brevis]|uniref:hypothetical protein n=1 Tax=Levilactobacillus brevis TaxID=1580 RepID=UPI00339C4237
MRNKKVWLYSMMLGVSITITAIGQQSIEANAATSAITVSDNSDTNTVQSSTSISDKDSENTSNEENNSSSAETERVDSADEGQSPVNTSKGGLSVDSAKVSETKEDSAELSSKQASSDSSATNSDTTNSVNLTDNEVVIPNKGKKPVVDNQLVLNADKTKATLSEVTSNAGDRYSYDDSTKTVTLKDAVDTDTVSATYKNVGTYHGMSINAVLQVGHLILHTSEHPAPNNMLANLAQLKFFDSFSAGVATYNVAQDELQLTFFDEKGKQVYIDKDGYITVGSLNGPSVNTAGNEYIAYIGDNDTKNYVTQDTVVSSIDNPNTNSDKVYAGTSSDFTDVLGAPTSENGAITFQLEGNTFKFISGTTRYSLKSKTHHWSYTLTTLSSATVAPAKLPDANLKADKQTANNGETVTFTLSQPVNILGQDTLLRYQTWQESMVLPVGVTYQSATLQDANGNSVEGKVTFDVKTRTVTFTADSDYLQNKMAMMGETYKLVATTIVSNDVVDGTVGTATAEKSIDEVTQANMTTSVQFINKRTLIVHYYKQGTTVSLHPDTQVTVGYGKTFNIDSLAINGYQVVKSTNNSGVFGENTSKDVVFEFSAVVLPEVIKIRVVDVSDKGEVLGSYFITGTKGSKYHIAVNKDYGVKLIYATSSSPTTGIFDVNSVIVNTYNYSYAVASYPNATTAELTTLDGLNRVVGTNIRSSNSNNDLFLDRDPKTGAIKTYVVDRSTGKVVKIATAKNGTKVLKVKNGNPIVLIKHSNGSTDVYEKATEVSGYTSGVRVMSNGNILPIMNAKIRVGQHLVNIVSTKLDSGNKATLTAKGEKKISVQSLGDNRYLLTVGGKSTTNKTIKLGEHKYRLSGKNGNAILTVTSGHEKTSYIFNSNQQVTRTIEVNYQHKVKIVKTNVYDKSGILSYQKLAVTGKVKKNAIHFSTNADLPNTVLTKMTDGYSAILTNTAAAVHIDIYRHGKLVKKVVTNAYTKTIHLDSGLVVILHQTDGGQNVITLERQSKATSPKYMKEWSQGNYSDKRSSRLSKNGSVSSQQKGYITKSANAQNMMRLPQTGEKSGFLVALMGVILNLGLVGAFKKWFN